MFDLGRRKEILGLLKKRKAKKVLVQVPEGLKRGALGLLDYLVKEGGINAFLSVEPCFGACDLRDREAEMLGCDVLLHVGHKDLDIKTRIPVVYYEYFMDTDFVPLLKKFAGDLAGHGKLCIVSTVQFARSLGKAKDFLERKGFEVSLGGDILGCDVSNAKRHESGIGAYLFIGSGRFHPLGLQEKTARPVLFLDVERRSLEDLSAEKAKMETKRRMRIQKAAGMDTFGVLVSTKQGQFRPKEAKSVKSNLTGKGKRVYMLVADRATPEKIMSMGIEVLVNTACPRLVEDAGHFRSAVKVVLSPEDVEGM